MKRKNIYHFTWLLLFLSIIEFQPSVRGALYLADTPGQYSSNTQDAVEVTLTIVATAQQKDKKATIKAELDWSVEVLEEELDGDPNIDFNTKFNSLEYKELLLNEKDLKLREYGIEKDAILYVVDINKSFEFTNFQLTSTLKFSYKAPPWRGIKYGLTYYGICRNQLEGKKENCAAYGKEVLINRGYVDNLDIGMDISRVTLNDKENGTCICPVCKQFVGNVESCSFYMCDYKVRGAKLLQVKQKDKKKEEKDDEKEGKYDKKELKDDKKEERIAIDGKHDTRFKLSRFISEGPENITKYSWLRITTKPLK